MILRHYIECGGAGGEIDKNCVFNHPWLAGVTPLQVRELSFLLFVYSCLKDYIECSGRSVQRQELSS